MDKQITVRKIVLANNAILSSRADLSIIYMFARERGWRVIELNVAADIAISKMGLSSDLLGEDVFTSTAVQLQYRTEEQIDEALASCAGRLADDKILIAIVGGIPIYSINSAYESYNAALDKIYQTRFSAMARYDSVLYRVDNAEQDSEMHAAIREAWSGHPDFREYASTEELIGELEKILDVKATS